MKGGRHYSIPLYLFACPYAHLLARLLARSLANCLFPLKMTAFLWYFPYKLFNSANISKDWMFFSAKIFTWSLARSLACLVPCSPAHLYFVNQFRAIYVQILTIYHLFLPTMSAPDAPDANAIKMHFKNRRKCSAARQLFWASWRFFFFNFNARIRFITPFLYAGCRLPLDSNWLTDKSWFHGFIAYAKKS